jgi:hypothetical protein
MGEGRGVHRVMVGKPEGKRPFGRPRRRWEDNIKMDLQEVGENILLKLSILYLCIDGLALVSSNLPYFYGILAQVCNTPYLFICIVYVASKGV